MPKHQPEIIDITSSSPYRNPSPPKPSNEIQATDEQQAILQFATKLKRQRKGDGSLVRVIAGAGTGKTTTLKLLSNQLITEQRLKVLYLVFNKQAQTDAEARFKSISSAGSNGNGHIHCKTMHGAALTTLRGENVSICNDQDIQKRIQSTFSSRVSAWLAQNGVGGSGNRKILDFKVELCCFYIFKTLENFYRSAEPAEKLSGSDYFTYYVAKLKHQEKIGFSDIGQFYTSAASELWNQLSSFQIPVSHDIYLKIVQLRGFVFSKYHVFLIDESQDLTACQIDLFVHQQVKMSKHVFLVGDSVQTIYSFRGARSKFITQLEGTNDFKLTKCFRFGKHIAFIANILLWIKEKSPQLPMFIPYRLTGMGSNPGLVHGAGVSLSYPFTVVARQNATLITKALALLHQDPNIKIAMNGGVQSFQSTIDQAIDLHRLSSGGKPLLPKFQGFDSFDAFKANAIELEQSQDMVLMSLLETYGDELPKKLNSFKDSVLRRAISPEQCDVLLTTTHQAKGLEWDRVEVEDDFLELDVQKKKRGEASVDVDGSAKPVMEFALPPHGDSLNLWYVAVTRARKEVLLPPKYWDLIEMMSLIKQNKPVFMKSDKTDQENENEKERFTKEEADACKALFTTFTNVK